MDINDSLNFIDNEFDGTLQEQEYVLWVPRKSAKLLSGRNVRLSTAGPVTRAARHLLVQNKWLTINTG